MALPGTTYDGVRHDGLQGLGVDLELPARAPVNLCPQFGKLAGDVSCMAVRQGTRAIVDLPGVV